LVEAESSATC